MGSRPTRLALVALAIFALAASAASAAGLRVLVLRSGNHTASNRTAATIDSIVIHATEGHFVGSVRWLRNPRSHGSAHFVVARDGRVAQLVSVTDVAWHAGSNYWNRHSIGIEHEGFTFRGGFTPAEYRASAQLVGYLAYRYGIPVDRRHIIGHDEVPNPYRRGFYGGVDGHQDPGKYWKWAYYMTLVRYYARHPEQPKYVHGTLRPSRPAAVVSGLPKAAKRTQPAVVSGLGAVISGAARQAGRSAPRPAPVYVVTKAKPAPRVVQHAPKPRPRPKPKPTRSVVDRNAVVHGHALWWSGITAERKHRRHIYKVDFLVDGEVEYTDHTWPFSFHRHEGWNTRTVANGRHMLVVRAYGTHHYRARKRMPVRVANEGIQLALAGVYEDMPMSGLAEIDVRPSESIDRVALYVDGRAVSRDGSSPYRLEWDTRAETEGPHALTVYARGRKRRVAEQLGVVVANGTRFPASLTRDWSPGR
ncbi:MAG TPA: N-acetylmuramoyl-L-alanine amidase [Gaiellaceae bacterium]